MIWQLASAVPAGGCETDGPAIENVTKLPGLKLLPVKVADWPTWSVPGNDEPPEGGHTAIGWGPTAGGSCGPIMGGAWAAVTVVGVAVAGAVVFPGLVIAKEAVMSF